MSYKENLNKKWSLYDVFENFQEFRAYMTSYMVIHPGKLSAASVGTANYIAGSVDQRNFFEEKE